MARINFLYVDIKVYPASIEEGGYSGYNMDSILIAEQPVLSTYENMGLVDGYWSALHEAINDWINQEAMKQGKELIYCACPQAPK